MVSSQNVLVDEIQAVLGEIAANGVDVHRCAAAISLGKIAHPKAKEVLQEALLDEDEDVRTDVVTALSMLADPTTADAVMNNFLGDPCPEVKLAAIETLVKLKYKPIIPHLLKLVTSNEDDEITWDEDAYYQDGWDDWLDIQFAVITALGELGIEEAVAPIVEALHDDMGQDISQVAIPALAILGDPGSAALNKLFEEGDSRMRRRICAELVLDQSSFSNSILDKCLSDKDVEVREIAVEKLLDYSKDDPRLEGFFEDAAPAIRALIIENIGAHYPEKVMAALNDKAAIVRKRAFGIIANHPENFEPNGFSEIVIAAIAGNPDVGGQAAIAWAALIGEPSVESLGKALENTKQPTPFRMGLIEALSKLDSAGFQWLANAAGDENRQVRISALEAIAEMAANESWPGTAGETLLAALNGDLVEPAEPDEEGATVSEDETTVPEGGVETVAAAADENLEIEETIDADGELGTVVAVSTIEQLMNKGIQTESIADEDYVEEEVVLNEQDERFIELSKQRAMRKRKVSLDVKVAPHQDVRRYAARLLSNLNQPGVVDALSNALDFEDEELTLAILDSLACLAEENGTLDDEISESIINHLNHSDSNIRRLAIRCLGWINTEAVKEKLLELVENSDVHIRQEVIRALGNLAVEREVLVNALKDEYSGVRMSAARALVAKPDQDTIAQLVTLSLGFDGMHRKDVAIMLGRLDPQKAGDLYLKVLTDEKSKRVWRVAIEVLGDLFAWSPDKSASLAA